MLSCMHLALKECSAWASAAVCATTISTRRRRTSSKTWSSPWNSIDLISLIGWSYFPPSSLLVSILYSLSLSLRVTFVQIVVCLVSLFAYGLAPVGFSYTTKRGLATGINLEKQLISYPVKQNFWIGPVWTDLVHLGAKYAPCMRNDTNIWRAIEHDRLKEMETACCIRNDKGGCVQTSRDKCSVHYSIFVYF